MSLSKSRSDCCASAGTPLHDAEFKIMSIKSARYVLWVFLGGLMCGHYAQAGLDQVPPAAPPATDNSQTNKSYVLGVDDQLTVQALHAEEISDKPIRIDSGGEINLPMVGRVKAAGLTVQQLETEIAERLKAYVQEPQVTISLMEVRSQPVSIIGAVNQPGVHQIQGNKTLVELLSMAGGVRNDAGDRVKVSRRPEFGRIPLPNARVEPGSNFSVAEVSLNSIMEATNPADNILVKPNDVISVPKAAMVYVVGEVHKSGGFVLKDQERVTALQALALAEGLSPTASPQKAKILRTGVGPDRTEVAVDLKMILTGKAKDVPMQSDDILVVPTSVASSILKKTLQTIVQTGTGIAIYRR